MKNVIMLLAFLSSLTLTHAQDLTGKILLAENSDTLNNPKVNLNLLKRNVISISVDNMYDLLGNNNNSNAVFNSAYLNYTRRFKSCSLRIGGYEYETETEFQSNNYTKLTDSTYTITSNKSLDYNYIGLRLGIEKNYLINNNLYFFYGVDINIAYVKVSTNQIISWYNINSSAPYSFGGISIIPSGYSNNYKLTNLGITPFIGITECFTPFISTSLEFDLLAYYSQMQNQSSSINLDEKFKLLVNFSF